MEILKFILIGLGLAMDAFAVSVSSGITIHKMHLRHALRIGLFFGFFQALMPYIGWHIGSIARGRIVEYDHWIAFVLLGFIGAKMIYEAYQDDEKREDYDPLNIYILFTLAVATSIDALAVGVTLSLLNSAIIIPSLIIGITTFITSFAGTYIGDHFGHKFNEKKLEIVGGIILILIGTKILLEHTFFA